MARQVGCAKRVCVAVQNFGLRAKVCQPLDQPQIKRRYPFGLRDHAGRQVQTDPRACQIMISTAAS